MPKPVRRDIGRQLSDERAADDVALALTLGSEALDDDRPEDALPYLRWARTVASGVGAVREALGVALYLLEDYDEANRELAAYRRITSRQDQNHLLADCARALGKPVTKVAELAEALLVDDRVHVERRTEAAIVWASALADAGEPGAGRAVLRRHVDLDGDVDEPLLRAWYVAGDLAERAGDPAEARTWFERILAVDEELFDTQERLDDLVG